jgi:hypothetical protein
MQKTSMSLVRAGVAVGVVVLAMGGGTTFAAGDVATTTIQVSAAPSLRHGDLAPVSAAGVRAIRRGKPIPAGYTLVGQTVQTTPGGPVAGAALNVRCAAPTRLRGLAAVGRIGFSVADRHYAGRRQALVTTYALSHPGVTSGTLYAVCR